MLNSIQQKLSKSSLAVHLSIKLRNQANMIIGYSLGESPDHRLNGEESLLRLLAPHCRSFVDVGANVGDWTELFSKYCPNDYKALLFEPGKTAFSSLEKKFKHTSNVEILQKAAGSELGTISFFEEPNAGVKSSVVQDFASGNAVKIEAKITRLDVEVPAHGWDSVDYVKIDTEGFDYQVLTGMEGLLEQKKIGFIQFEYNQPWANTNSTLLGAFGLLKKYGYVYYLIHSNGLYELDYSKYHEYFRYSNFLAVSPDRDYLLKPILCGKV